MSFEIKTHTKVPSKRATKPVVNDDVDDKDEENGESGFKLRPKKEAPKPEFYVSDEFGNFFCGYKDAYPYWSPKISEARELTEEAHFNTLVRWERNIRNLKKEYL